MSKMDSTLNDLAPVYFPNEDNIISSLFLPIAEYSKGFDCLSGYFSSKAIAELAEPLSVLYQNPEAKGRFLIGPSLSEQDRDALLKAYNEDESIFRYLIDEVDIDKDSIAKSTLDVMKHLIWTKRLDIRIVLMREGMMHAKIWLFNTNQGDIAVHGSSNATKSGLISNFEQLVLSREWESHSSKAIIAAYRDRFESFWNQKRSDSLTLNLNDKTISDIMKSTPLAVSETELPNLMYKLWTKLENAKSQRKLTIPNWLQYRDGDYKHQGEAVDAWLSHEKRGTLEIATGGGKTLTSLVCASLAFSNEPTAILVIAVPTKPLIKQWAEDVRNFSIEPIDTEGLGTKNIVKLLRKLIKEHQLIPQHSAVIITHDALKSPDVLRVLEKYKEKIMLIGDEAHNLGSRSFVDSPPNFISYRLGLSATPERQYDEEGTMKLFSYFGPIVYEFPLERAIGTCLVPFQYIAHKVYLSQSEAEDWKEITDKINRLSWSEDRDTKKIIEQLQIRRKAIAESAIEKVNSFSLLVKNRVDRVYSLAFCTDKDPRQLNSVNDVLREQGFIFHQITGEETSSKSLMSELINSYKSGNIEVLTSKRVLDEGFNIPPIKTAYFLASSGTKRTWVQRLGRVLRKSDATGKVDATIHDFVVFPPDNSSEFKALLNAELSRVQWFVSLAKKDKSIDRALTISNELIAIKESL